MYAIRLLIRVGKGRLYAPLVLDTSPGAVQLRKCDPEVQKQYTEEPVNLLIVKDDGSVDNLKVPVTALNPDQARQVFNGGDIRNAGEQRAYLETQRNKAQERRAVALNNEMGYIVFKGKVRFLKDTVLTERQILDLLVKLKSV